MKAKPINEIMGIKASSHYTPNTLKKVPKVTPQEKPIIKAPPTTNGSAITLNPLSEKDKQNIRQNIFNQYKEQPFKTGFLRSLDPTSGGLNRTEKSYEIYGGNISDLDKSSTAYRAGSFAGTAAQFAVPYMGSAGVIGKTISKIPQVAKMGKVGQAITKSVATDLAVGLPLNVNYAYNKEGLQGTEALKSIALNTGIDLVTGGIIEAIGGVVLKSGKKVTTKAEFDALPAPEKEEVIKMLPAPAQETKLLTEGVNWTPGKAPIRQLPEPRFFVDSQGGASFSPLRENALQTEHLLANRRTSRVVGEEIDSKLIDDPITGGVKKVFDDNDLRDLEVVLSLSKKTGKDVKEIIPAVYSNIENQINDAIEDALSYFRNYKPRGTELIPDKYGSEFNKIRASNNDDWYSRLYKKLGRRPSGKAIEDEGRRIILEDIEQSRGFFVDAELSNYYKMFSGLNEKTNLFDSGLKSVTKNTDGTYNFTYGDNVKVVKPDYSVAKGNKEMPYVATADELSFSPKPISRKSAQTGAIRKATPRNIDAAMVKNTKPSRSIPQAPTKPVQPTLPKKGTEIPKEQIFSKNGDLPKQKNIAESFPRDDVATGIINEQKTRGFSKNIATDASMDMDIRKSYIEKPDTYDVLSNPDTLKRANDILASKGLNESYDNIIQAMASNSLKPEHIPLARKVANQLAKDGDIERARAILSEIAVKLTESGQFSQAARILRNSDPMAMVQFIQKTIDKTNTALSKRFKNFNELKLTDDEFKRLANIDMGDEEAIKQAVEDIGKRLAKEIPTGNLEKFDELRRIAMLGNFKTQARNVVGNIPLWGERKISNKVSAIMQKTLPKEQRTQSLIPTKESRQMAKQLFDNDKEWLLSSNKWDTNDIRKILNSERQVFNQSLIGKVGEKLNASEKTQVIADNIGLEGFRKLVYGALQLGDVPFLKSAYTDRMASYLTAKGYKSLDDIPQAALDIAREEALKATFRDANNFAMFINKLKHEGGVLGKTVEATIPFVTTPTNLVRRSIDFSPAGFIRSLAKIKNADDVPKVIDEIAKGFTGTALLGLGILLAQNGILIGSPDKNKNKANYEKTTGKLPYSIQTPLGTISYDWAQPFGSQLAISAEIFKAYNESMQETGEFTFKDFTNAIVKSGYAGVDVILESSVYQNVLDLFSGYGSAGERIVQNLTEYPQQVIPTLLGQTARTNDKYVRMAYDKTDATASWLNQVKAKTPNASETLPIKYDVWGRPTKRIENPVLRAGQEFFNPANILPKTETPLDKEILSLYKQTGLNSVFPKTAPYNFEINKVPYNLNNKDISEFQRIMGEYSLKEASKLINSAEYKKMNTIDKTAELNKVYNDAYEKAKYNYLVKKNVPVIVLLGKSQQGKYESVKNVVSDKQFYKIAKSVQGMDTDIEKAYKILEQTKSPEVLESFGIQTKAKDGYIPTSQKAILLQRAGVKADEVVKAKKSADTNTSGDVSKAEATAYLNNRKDLTRAQKSAIMLAMVPSLKIKNNPYK